MLIPGAFRAWNLVISQFGELVSADEVLFALTRRSRTAASTRTIAIPSAACSGVQSIMNYESTLLQPAILVSIRG